MIFLEKKKWWPNLEISEEQSKIKRHLRVVLIEHSMCYGYRYSVITFHASISQLTFRLDGSLIARSKFNLSILTAASIRLAGDSPSYINSYFYHIICQKKKTKKHFSIRSIKTTASNRCSKRRFVRSFCRSRYSRDILPPASHFKDLCVCLIPVSDIYNFFNQIKIPGQYDIRVTL